jgi:hypothetical protein
MNDSHMPEMTEQEHAEFVAALAELYYEKHLEEVRAKESSR